MNQTQVYKKKVLLYVIVINCCGWVFTVDVLRESTAEVEDGWSITSIEVTGAIVFVLLAIWSWEPAGAVDDKEVVDRWLVKQDW